MIGPKMLEYKTKVKRLTLPKELVLDYRKWRCGDKGKRGVCQLGDGDTELLNNNGRMCCLGQFCYQVGVARKVLIRESEPQDLVDEVIVSPLMRVRKDIDGGFWGVCNTRFTEKAIDINDNCLTTIAQKVRKLKSLCSKYRRKLLLKNFPKKILEELNMKNMTIPNK